MLRALGAYVIDADVVAREVVAVGSPLLSTIAQAFAPEVVLAEDGSLNRSHLRQIVSSSDVYRQRLNGLVHPAIGQRIQEMLTAQRRLGTRCCVVEAALMVETGTYRNYDMLVVTTCPEPLQLRRIVARDGGDLDAARAWVATQASQESKARRADHVVRTDCTLEELRAKVARLWTESLAPQ